MVRAGARSQTTGEAIANADPEMLVATSCGQ